MSHQARKQKLCNLACVPETFETDRKFWLAAWFDDGSEEALKKDLENLQRLKQQSDEDFTWILQNWHASVNLKGWATVLGLGTS